MMFENSRSTSSAGSKLFYAMLHETMGEEE